jgi:uncharacterized protein (DUF2147 family)
MMAAALLLFGDGARAQKAADALGLWEHPENGSRIELFGCGRGLCARIRRVTDGQRTDERNPDETLRSRPIIGLVIVEEARQTGPATWSGRLYNRIDGRTYDGQFTVKAAGRLEMTGCTAVVVCRTVVWRRVDDPQARR